VACRIDSGRYGKGEHISGRYVKSGVVVKEVDKDRRQHSWAVKDDTIIETTMIRGVIADYRRCCAAGERVTLVPVVAGG